MAPSPRPAAARAEPRCFVGPLVENELRAHHNPRDYCVEDIHYLGAPHRLGRIPVFGLEEAEAGGYVQLRATRHDDLLAALKKQGACPEDQPFPVQARSDWSPEEGSYLTSRERLRAASFLRATSARSVELVAVDAPARASGRKHGAPTNPEAPVAVTIRNPFDFPLEGLSLVVHYEGGRGKPMPHYVTLPVSTTAPGEATTVTAPASVEHGGAWYHYDSVSLEGRSGGCTFVESTFQR